MSVLSNRVKALKPSPTVSINALAGEMKAKGIDVCNLSAGQPDFPTPENVKEAGIQAIRNNDTYYTPVPGTVKIREAVARKLLRDNGLTYDPTSEIMVSVGGKQILYNLFQALVNPGDGVMIPALYWVSYPPQVELAQGEPVIVPATADDGFKVTPDHLNKAYKDNCKILVLNSPSNPTGAFYLRKELEPVVEWALSKNLIIISDEIYESLLYVDEPFTSIPSLSDEAKASTVIAHGTAKAYSMTGWRLGYAAGPKEIIKACCTLQSQINTNTASMAQTASIEALDNANEEAKRRCGIFKQRRDMVVGRLQAMPGIRTLVPEGAFYIFPEVAAYYGKSCDGKTIEGSVDFCAWLLEKVHVAAVPGAAFGDDACIRISYASSEENLKNGMDRIEAGLKTLS